MKNLIILTTIVTALLTLTGCGSGNQAQQTTANQQAITPTPTRRVKPVNARSKNQIVTQNSNINFKKMTNDQINRKYDQLKQSSPSQATNFGLQAWASRFPRAASKKPANNSWSMGVLERNRNSRNTQTSKTVQKNITGESTPLLASTL